MWAAWVPSYFWQWILNAFVFSHSPSSHSHSHTGTAITNLIFHKYSCKGLGITHRQTQKIDKQINDNRQTPPFTLSWYPVTGHWVPLRTVRKLCLRTDPVELGFSIVCVRQRMPCRPQKKKLAETPSQKKKCSFWENTWQRVLPSEK